MKSRVKLVTDFFKSKKFSSYWYILLAAILFLAGGVVLFILKKEIFSYVCLGIGLVAGIVFALLKIIAAKRPIKVEEYERLVQEDIDKAEALAFKDLKVTKEEFIHKPIIISYPYQFNDNVTLQTRTEKEKVHYSASIYMVLFFLDNEMFKFSVRINHIDGTISYESICEFYYRDLVSFNVNANTLVDPKGTRDTLSLEFSLLNGRSFEFKIRDEALDSLALGVRSISESEDAIISSVREVFRQKV